ncbi:anoctamin-8 isoform X1 [Alosa sapidissima]|uniref:anoctamin-8 isoform X1 n=1 Tax=Alosa sapidissima TaxID=34773 RepID=UPI001C086C7F|nr:anoctamin-8 isoform X1 [Alosa sapidissima]
MSSEVLNKWFGRRLSQARQYIMYHKSRLKPVPTEDCDIVMTFPDNIDDHTLLWLLNQIRLGIPQIIVHIRYHKHIRGFAFFITTTFENLLRGAEQIGMYKQVKSEYGGGIRRFSCEEDTIYEHIESELCFFTSQERQTIIKYWLDNLRARQGDVLHSIHFLEGQPIIPELKTRGVILQMFPLHDQRILSQLITSWVQAVCERQPLDDICGYFGVKIAMYFAWLGFYTNSMLYPAVIGLLLWMLSETDQKSQDICCVVFALFNVIWATLFLERWKRREAELAFKWGTLDTPAESIEEPRPQFRGVKRNSPVTGCEELYYPPWKRNVFRWLVSLPVCLLCLCFVFLAMFICLELQELVMEMKELPSLTRFLPKVILAVTVSTCDEVYKKIALWLNDMENYKLQSAYDNNLIIKLVFFQFINSYLSLFYIGFYLKDMERLKEMLATLLIIRQFLQNIKEVLQPYLYEHQKLREFTLRTVWEVLQTSIYKYVALGKAWMTSEALDKKEKSEASGKPEKKGRKCLLAGYRNTQAEEGDEENTLKQRKVSFTEKVKYKGSVSGTKTGRSLLDDDSPTLVEEGADCATVFEISDNDSDTDSGEASKDPPGNVHPLPLSSGSKTNVSLPPRPKATAESETESKKASWMEPPDEKESPTLTQPEIESCMLTYEQGTLQDYQEMFIQFGYVVLFSSAFPLAAMCALINNIIEIRSDALKLCTGLQRPYSQRVENIGQWQTAMEAMGLIAIIVNCYLIGQCGQIQRLFPWLSPEMTIVSIVILEHFAILLKYVIHMAIPDIPGWVADEMAKLEYKRREALKRHERQAQQQYQLQLRKKREEEELRLAEQQARQEWDQERAETPESPVGEEAQHDRGLVVGKPGGDKPKRPSSLLTSNNVLKLKQMIPLQGKFTTLSSPTGGEPKLPGFLNFKFLKSPEMKKDPAAAISAAASSNQEKSQSPSKSFNPGKLFHFTKSDGTDQHSKAADSTKTTSGQQSHHQNTTPEQLTSQEDDGEESTDSDASPFKKL